MRRGAAWGLASAGVAALGTLATTPFALERIGLEQFGVLMVILAVSSYAGSLDFGLTWAAISYFSGDLARGDARALASRFATLSACLLAVGLTAAAISLALAPQRLVTAVALAAASFVLSLQIGLLNALLHAGQWFTDAGRVLFLMSTLTPVAAYAALSLQPDMRALLAVALAVNAVVVLAQVACALHRRPFALRDVRWDAARLREMVAFGGWSSAGKAISMMMLHLDRVVVAFAGSLSGVAYYATPANLASRVNVLGGLTTAQYLATASRLHASGDRDALSAHHARARRFLVCVTLAIALPLVTLGPAFLEVWVGADMATAGGPVLVLLSVANAIVAVTCIDAALLEATGRAHVTAIAVGAWAMVAVVATAVLAEIDAVSVAAAVAVWLAGVGCTTAAIAHQGHRHRAAAAFVLRVMAVAAPVAVVAAVAAIEFQTLVSALLAMAAMTTVVLVLGFVVILQPDDRRLVLAR